MEIFIGIVGLLIAWLTYQKTFHSVPDTTEYKENMLAVFITTQKLSLEVQSLVQQYIDEKDGANKEMYPNITFQEFLHIAKDEFDKSLSDKLYQDLKGKDFTKSNIETLLRMIETQNNSLIELRNQLIFLNK
jgi:hypothetical protein